MRLHLLGLPHTVTSEEYSHCAFTGKVLRFAAMMKGMGYHITHYGVEGAETEADEHVRVMYRDDQLKLMGHDGKDKTRFYQEDARTDSLLYMAYNKLLRERLMDRVTQTDLVLCPFGHAHHDALKNLPFIIVESGIGYDTLYQNAHFRVFESSAWLHYHQGKAGRWGKNYEWVIPNYYDPKDWTVKMFPDSDAPVVFMGRLEDVKGLRTVVEVAKHRPDINFVICGQGDPRDYLSLKNVHYEPPKVGRERSEFLGNARAVIMPSVFTEPFGGVAVEAQMCGTPAITTTYGAFLETVEDEMTGFRCHTLGDFLAAIDRAPELDRLMIAHRARTMYGYDRVKKMYDRAFKQIQDLRDTGWYSQRSTFIGPNPFMEDVWQRSQESKS